MTGFPLKRSMSSFFVAGYNDTIGSGNFFGSQGIFDPNRSVCLLNFDLGSGGFGRF